jgi:hypothetical protein
VAAGVRRDVRVRAPPPAPVQTGSDRASDLARTEVVEPRAGAFKRDHHVGLGEPMLGHERAQPGRGPEQRHVAGPYRRACHRLGLATEHRIDVGGRDPPSRLRQWTRPRWPQPFLKPARDRGGRRVIGDPVAPAVDDRAGTDDVPAVCPAVDPRSEQAGGVAQPGVGGHPEVEVLTAATGHDCERGPWHLLADRGGEPDQVQPAVQLADRLGCVQVDDDQTAARGDTDVEG